MTSHLFSLEGNTVVVDTTKINQQLLTAHQDARELFFRALSGYSSSTEMMTTWIGRKPEGGGMVVIPWNTLATLVNSLITEVLIAEPVVRHSQ